MDRPVTLAVIAGAHGVTGEVRLKLFGEGVGSLKRFRAFNDFGGGKALMRRVLASNPHENIFHIGFKACNDYDQGEVTMPKVQCPTLFLLASKDQMTQPKAAQGLIQWAKQGQVKFVNAGHQLMVEAPEETLKAMVDFLRK